MPRKDFLDNFIFDLLSSALCWCAKMDEKWVGGMLTSGKSG
jgi:hypothetical protein